jgi:hypothetical protein
MRVTFKNGVLTVKTGIKATALEAVHTTKAVARDKAGDEVYRVVRNGNAAINQFGMECNQVVDGELAVVVAYNEGVDKDAVLKQHGDALLAAKQYLPQIASDLEAKAADLASIFDDEEVVDAAEVVAAE